MQMEYKVDIDFDKASIEWRKNKKQKQGGSFEYRCMHIKKNGKICNKTNCQSAQHKIDA
jgi:hypothetical protein